MKTSAKRIAERYVKALFDVTTTDAERAQVEKDFAALQQALTASDALRDLLSNPLLSRAQQGKAIEAVLTHLKAGKATQQFVSMLARQKRLPLLPEIIHTFALQVAASRGEVGAEIISAGKLEDKDIKAIGDRLSKALGKKIVVETRQDPALLGGMIVKVGSRQLDASLSGKLRRLKLSLKTA